MQRKTLQHVTLGLALTMACVGLMAPAAVAQTASVPSIVPWSGCSFPQGCQFVVKPSSWQPTNDGSYNVDRIRWDTWTADYATGTAMVSSRTCWAACMKFAVFPALVVFSDPASFHGYRVFARGDVISLNPADAGQDMIDRGAAPFRVPKQADEWTPGREA